MVAFVENAENPHHRHARLVPLTDKGREAYAAAQRRQAPRVKALAQDLEVDDIRAAQKIFERLRTRLETSEGVSSPTVE